MNTKQIIVTGLTASLIASCCTFDPKNGPLTNVQVEEYVELVGFDPGPKSDAEEFKKFLSRHDSQVYRIQEYQDGNPVGPVIGGLKDVTCELKGKIDYWTNNPPGGKAGKGGATKFTGQLGASCSTSCKPPEIQNSIRLADDFRRKYGSGPGPCPKKHHKGE